VELKSIVPWGRSLSEYREMFSLSEADLDKQILGCGDGPASFNAELSNLGGNVISVDPVYQFSASDLQIRISEAYDEVMPQMHINKHKYVWKNIPSVEALGKTRQASMSTFIMDYQKGKDSGRYIDAALPELSFPNKKFDLALCSHYLFLYSKHVGLSEHVAALKELCRVASEVRVYPLLALDGKVSPHLKQVIESLEAIGLVAEVIDVNYEFQKGAKQMLVVKSV
jgi:hypothetical protein